MIGRFQTDDGKQPTDGKQPSLEGKSKIIYLILYTNLIHFSSLDGRNAIYGW